MQSGFPYKPVNPSERTTAPSEARMFPEGAADMTQTNRTYGGDHDRLPVKLLKDNKAESDANMPSSRQLAAETTALVEAVRTHNAMARSGDQTYPPLSYDEARSCVYAFYRGGKKHALHVPGNRELYRLEDQQQNLKERMESIDGPGNGEIAKTRAERVAAYAQERGIGYDQARAALGIR